MKKKQTKPLSQERLREIAWEVGSNYPIPHTANYIALAMVHPPRGHIHWHLQEEDLTALRSKESPAFEHAPIVVRVYDVTDIIFDGLNAHSFFDIEVQALTGNYYFNAPRLGRSYLAEIGLRAGDGAYRYIARSNAAFIERDRPSGNYQVGGMFVGQALKRIFPVENVFDAKIYDRMSHELGGLDRAEPLLVGMVYLGLNRTADINSPLGSFITKFTQRLTKFGGQVELFAPVLSEASAADEDNAEAPTDKAKEEKNSENNSLLKRVEALSEETYEKLSAAHKKTPFQLIHTHDWYSSIVGLRTIKRLKLPLVVSLHSTEHERTQGYESHHLSAAIYEWEKKAIQAANLVIVPHSSTRQQVISLYEAPSEKVVIIPDVLEERREGQPPDASEVRNWFGLSQDAPLALFASEMSHAAGADLLVDALPNICSRHGTAQFIFAGDGPLKDELEGRTHHAGIGHRCRFLGDVSRETFEAILLTSDFVVIPARTWQDEGLAQMALEYGKPVLTTHQAGINCVVHGENGLVTYDNPGSIIWGVQEMLTNPLQGTMLRLVARKKAQQAPSLENIAAQHYMYYEIVLKNFTGGRYV